MSAHDRHGHAELEHDLIRAVHDLAPEPAPDLLARAMRAVESTPQRRGLLRTAGPGGWGWSTLAAMTAGTLAAVAIGFSAASLIGTPPASSSAPPRLSPSASGSPQESRAALEPDAEWEQIELPDPAPGVDGGAVPTDIVGFGGGYVVVGSVEGFCGSDILTPEPGCGDRLADLTDEPRLQAAVVWTSEDARSWELIESPTFERGSMLDAATDGERLVVAGRVLDSPQYGSFDGEPAVWTSTDGRHWDVAASGGSLPALVEWTPNGWVGVRNTTGEGPGGLIVDAGPQFFASEDGLTWSPVTDPGGLGPGRVEDLAVDDVGTVVAVGYHEISTTEGLLESSTPLAWRTVDGHTWEPAPVQPAFAFGGASGGLYMQAISRTSDVWMALGRADDVEDGVGAWTSSDGLSWTRQPEGSAPDGETAEADYVTVNLLFNTDPGLVATGTVPGESGSETAVWLSADGSTWELVRANALASWGIRALLADGNLVLAAAADSPSTDNYLPIVLVATR